VRICLAIDTLVERFVAEGVWGAVSRGVTADARAADVYVTEDAVVTVPVREAPHTNVIRLVAQRRGARAGEPWEDAVLSLQIAGLSAGAEEAVVAVGIVVASVLLADPVDADVVLVGAVLVVRARVAVRQRVALAPCSLVAMLVDRARVAVAAVEGGPRLTAVIDTELGSVADVPVPTVA
jgi:hypothetical protein